MKLFWLSTLLIFAIAKGFSQDLLTLEELDTVKMYTSVEEAMKSPNEVIRLELKGDKLKQVPNEVYLFKNLQYLDLTRNKLDTFPKQFEMLTQLRVLILNRNKINYITESIGQLKHLLVFKASNNLIYEVDKSISNLKNIQTLDLWENGLYTLPETIQDLPNLIELDLRINPIKDAVQEELQEYLPNCKMYFSIDCKCY